MDVGPSEVHTVHDSIMLEDTTMTTGRKCAPGKRLVKIKKTRITNVDGYMQAEDYTSYEEQDEVI